MSAYLPRAASAYLPRAAIKAATPAERMYVREFVYLLNFSSKGLAIKCPICSNRISVLAPSFRNSPTDYTTTTPKSTGRTNRVRESEWSRYPGMDRGGLSEGERGSEGESE